MCLPDSETDGLPADLLEFREFRELAVELVDEAVATEHSETLLLLDRRAAAAAAAAAAVPQDDAVGALELRPCKPACNPWWRPVWVVNSSNRRFRNLCSRDSCSLCTVCFRSRSSKLCKQQI